MRAEPPSWSGASLPTDLSLLAALRGGGRLTGLLEALPAPRLFDQFRLAGAPLPEVPDRDALRAQLPRVRRHVETDEGAQQLVSAWAAVHLPGFLAAPGQTDVRPWRGAVLCRLGAMTIGEPRPPTHLVRAADAVIAGQLRALDDAAASGWSRWFGLRDLAVQAEALAGRIERTLADVTTQLAPLADRGDDPLRAWVAFEAAANAVRQRQESLRDVVQTTVARLRAEAQRLGVAAEEPLALAALAAAARVALVDLGLEPTPPPTVPLAHLIERLEPPPSPRDRAMLEAEAAALAAGGIPAVVAPVLSALGRLLAEDRPPRAAEQALFEEQLSGRYCRLLAGGHVGLREPPVFTPVPVHDLGFDGD